MHFHSAADVKMGSRGQYNFFIDKMSVTFLFNYATESALATLTVVYKV